MEETLVRFAEFVTTAIDFVMIGIVAVGTVVTVGGLILGQVKHQRLPTHVREIWLRFAAWILLALEFALAADLIDTVVAPTWEEIGQLGAIAGIRIALGYFLGRDISEYSEGQAT